MCRSCAVSLVHIGRLQPVHIGRLWLVHIGRLSLVQYRTATDRRSMPHAPPKDCSLARRFPALR